MTVASVSTQKDSPQGKFARAVKLALYDRAMTIKDLARELGYARNTISLAINHGVNRRARAAITRFLNL